MTHRPAMDEWFGELRRRWGRIHRAYNDGQRMRLSVCRTGDLNVETRFEAQVSQPDRQTLTGVPAIVVGVDIREWTRRDWAIQPMISALLFENVRRSCSILERMGLLSESQVLGIHPTGDGMLVVIGCGSPPGLADDCWNCLKTGAGAEARVGGEDCPGDKRSARKDEVKRSCIDTALAMVFTLNAIVHQDNSCHRFEVVCSRRKGHEAGDVLGYLPVYLRYAMACGSVLPIPGVEPGGWAFVGEPMVACSRMLATDHGNHFLIGDRLFREMDRCGGLLQLGTGSSGMDWGQVLYTSELSDRKIKHGSFRYVDCFGDHTDAPLLKALGQDDVAPRRYQIGSHDMKMLD